MCHTWIRCVYIYIQSFFLVIGRTSENINSFTMYHPHPSISYPWILFKQSKQLHVESILDTYSTIYMIYQLHTPTPYSTHSTAFRWKFSHIPPNTRVGMSNPRLQSDVFIGKSKWDGLLLPCRNCLFSGEKICVGKAIRFKNTQKKWERQSPFSWAHATLQHTQVHRNHTESLLQESCPVGMTPSQGDSHHQDDITFFG